MTPDHYVYVAAGAAASFASRKAIVAGEVRAGMLMWHVGASEVPQLRRVQGVREVTQTGYINVLTVQGVHPLVRGTGCCYD